MPHEPVASSEPPAPQAARCANCGTLLQGPWCYRCGQEAHDPLTRFRGAVHEMFENVLHFDGRIWNTLLPLYTRPGFLTGEYLAGRRVRYVAPLKLMFFLAIIAFLVLRVGLELGPPPGQRGTASLFAQAPDAAAVSRLRAREDARIAQALAQPGLPTVARAPLLRAQRQIDQAAQQRLVQLAGHATAPASAIVPAVAPPPAAPVHIEGLAPAPGTHPGWLLRHLHQGLQSGAQHPKRLMIGVLRLLPQTMLLLLPLFALVLKIAFPRRLYMEHLIVALHSHAFAFLDLIVLAALGMLAGWAAPVAPLATLLGWLGTAAGWWLVIYPLLMQRRVYRQSWPAAVAGYLAIGAVYALMLATAIVLALGVSLWH